MKLATTVLLFIFPIFTNAGVIYNNIDENNLIPTGLGFGGYIVGTASSFEFVSAMQFTALQTGSVRTIEAVFRTMASNEVTMSIHQDGNGVPGAQLDSVQFEVIGNPCCFDPLVLGGVTNGSAVLQAGTNYWLQASAVGEDAATWVANATGDVGNRVAFRDGQLLAADTQPLAGFAINSDPSNAIELSKKMQLIKYIGIDLPKRGVMYASALGPLIPLCPVTLSLTCVALIGGTAAASLLEGYMIGRIIADPPDTDYLTVFQPKTYSPLVVDIVDSTSADAVTRGNLYFAKQAEFYAVLEAWLIALERYQGAVEAGDSSAAAAQEAALNEYIMMASSISQELATLNENFLLAFQQLIGDVTLLESDIQIAMAELSQNGFDELLTAQFVEHGLDDNDIDAILAMVLETDFNRIPLDLFDAGLASSEGLRDFSSFTALASPCMGDECVVTVPEPGSLTLFGIGLLGLGLARRKAA